MLTTDSEIVIRSGSCPQTPFLQTLASWREFLQPSPQVPIQCPILYRLREMIDVDPFASRQVGDGSSHLENAVISPSTQIQRTSGLFDYVKTRRIKLTMLSNQIIGGPGITASSRFVP